jgi:pyruvate kinase
MHLHLSPIIEALHEVSGDMQSLVEENAPILAQIQPANQTSAINLLHYLAFRRHDLRLLQEKLSDLGLSSLGRTETHVMSSVLTVLQAISHLTSAPAPRPPALSAPCDANAGRRLLSRNTESLLGAEPEGRKVRIMVTMPSSAATDYPLVRDLLRNGMNCMRINCAHDAEPAWSNMIRNLRQAEQETGRSCKIEMDLAGPKLRTGPLQPGPPVLKIRPERDPLGRVLSPARLWLTPQATPEPPPPGATATLLLPRRWLQTTSPGDAVRFTDTRGAKRTLTITESAGKNRWAECQKTAYLAPGIVFKATPSGAQTRLGPLPSVPSSLTLRPGDTLVLTRDLSPAPPASPARIGVTLPAVFACAQPGEPIWFDDGQIGGIIRQVNPEEITVEIQHAKAAGSKLGAEKGINLPETALITPALTGEDLAVLPFIARNADILAYSFVRTEEDVRLLQSHLAAVGAPHLGILLKIETRQAFENLPSLLLAALGSPHVGVMIARGDLAIECGYQRLAEVQEEILWIAEAAHVPVVWATQVLESLVKKGIPSRSEITDAAMGVRAECVMLNKGPYILDAVQALHDILDRMQDHQLKKRSMLRKLAVAEDFPSGVPGEVVP